MIAWLWIVPAVPPALMVLLLLLDALERGVTAPAPAEWTRARTPVPEIRTASDTDVTDVARHAA
jgi:hypothetical protein